MLLTRGLAVVIACFLLIGCGDKGELSDGRSQATIDDVEKPGPPVSGDWLIIHALSDPEQLNPLTSNDASASTINQNIFQSLLSRDPRSLELEPLVATARPAIAEDKLSYTFEIRRDVRFQDGRPLTGEDVLFSIKAIKCPLVNAPFLRVYFDSVVDAQLLDEYSIRFTIREPYFLNESVLGGIDVLPRHYYDPENLLKDVSIADLRKPVDELPAGVKKFADDFNRNFSRNPMGSGPYKFGSWKTGREIELIRDQDYWGNGKQGIDQPYLDRYKYRIINNPDAALVRLKSGSLDEMGLTPVQHVRGTDS
jgi:peptide/nickel transport system substrate-binding protein